MKRKARRVMEEVLRHELLALGRKSYADAKSAPRCVGWARGPFDVAVWHEDGERSSHKLIAQVCLRGCLGMGMMRAEGYSYSPDGRRVLDRRELWEYC